MAITSTFQKKRIVVTNDFAGDGYANVALTVWYQLEWTDPELYPAHRKSWTSHKMDLAYDLDTLAAGFIAIDDITDEQWHTWARATFTDEEWTAMEDERAQGLADIGDKPSWEVYFSDPNYNNFIPYGA